MDPPDEDESVVVFTQPPRDEFFSLLNGGRGGRRVPLTPLENDSIRKIIQEHPDSCLEKRPFGWIPEGTNDKCHFPLSWLCSRQATSDVIQLAYNAHPPAIYDEEQDGRSPLHYACARQASLELVQFLVERNPAALKTADKHGLLPLLYACRNKPTLEVVQFLVERDPTALETAKNRGWLPFGELPLHMVCVGQASLELVQFLVERNPAALETVDKDGELPLHMACRAET